MTRSAILNRLMRLGQTVLFTVLVFASLLTFPSAIPWMVAFWLAWHAFLVFRGRSGWLPLVVCATILAVKRVDWPPASVLAVVMLAACLVRLPRFPTVGTPWAKRLAWAGVAGLWIAWAWMAADWHGSIRRYPPAALHPKRPVVCVGDSLTAFGYPKCLRELVVIPVVDHGRNGITARDAIHHLSELIALDPKAVVIELGGHDFLRGYSRAETKESLEEIIQACRSVGAEVILVEVPRGFITDPFGGLEREMAREHGLELIPDTAIRRLVLWSPTIPPGMWLPPELHLSDDGLHPNANGNEMLADYAADALARVFGPDVRANGGESER